jgi:hypothetical protein
MEMGFLIQYISYSVKMNEGHSFLYCGDKRVVFYDELFDVLHKSHTERTGHGGRDTMQNDLKTCRIGT